MKSILIFLLLVSISGFGQIDTLSDEFNRPCSLYEWQEVNTVEQWNASHLEVRDIGITNDDELTLMPWTTAWYADYRSNLLFKEVSGNFIFSSRVRAINRAMTGLPSSTFSLGGLMLRIPTGITPATWTPGLENYIFLSIARAGGSSEFQ